MTDLRKAAEMALEMFDWLERRSMYQDLHMKETHEALRQALAHPVDAVNMSQERVDETVKREHEPVVFYRCNGCGHAYEQVAPSSCDCMEGTGFQRVNYYTAPPKKEWVGLTDKDKEFIAKRTSVYGWNDYEVIEASEVKLKEKNT